MKRTRRAIILLSLFLLLPSGGSPFLHASPLASWAIRLASHEDLLEMAFLRGVETEGKSDNALRSLLYEREGVEEPVEEEAEEGRYTLNVRHADILEKDGENSLVTLLGSVRASFRSRGEEDEKELSSNKMVVDVDGSLLSAMGNVTYRDKGEKASLQTMEGDIITLNWERSHLTVTNGMSETKRKNSEDEEIRFFTRGGEISYNTEEGGIFFRKGFITNNRENAYSSLTADKLVMMDNGDMVMRNAHLSIGRVPVFWVPVLLFPGSRMVGNPAIGYESGRGWFVNTSFEIYGRNESLASSSSDSSFTRLLEQEDDSEKVLDGPVYRKRKEGEELSPLCRWARESGSFLTITADSYEKSGLCAGIESKTNFRKGKIILDLSGNVAVTPSGVEKTRTYSSYPKTRYMVDASLAVDTDFLDMKILFPFSSDPSFKRTYKNRFSAFSLDHLLGARWPTDYTSDVTSHTWKLTGSLRLPSEWKSSYLDTLSVAFEASALSVWKRSSGFSDYAYRLRGATIPSLTATMGGTLFSVNSGEEKRKGGGEGADEASGETTEDPLVNDMLHSLYRAEETKSEKVKRSVRLTYKLSEKLTRSAKSSDGFSLDTNYLSSLSTGAFVLTLIPDSRYLTLTQSIVPKYRAVIDETKSAWKTKTFQVTAESKATIPLIGLTYLLAEKLFTSTETQERTGKVVREEKPFSFSGNCVTTHRLTLSKTFGLPSGTIGASLTYVLPPLKQSLLPTLTFRIGGWVFSASFKFLQENDILAKNLITCLVTYSGPHVRFSLKDTYQCASYRADKFWYPFTSASSLSLSLRGMTLAASYDYTNQSAAGGNYFNSLSLSFSFKPLRTTLTFRGPYDALEKSTWTTSVSFSAWRREWWKRRCSLSLDLSLAMNVNFLNPYSTNLSCKAGFRFAIREFLDLAFSVTSANNSFFMYRRGDGSFDWLLMMEDLARSFDIIGGGNRRTNFTMSSINLELIHYMDDWTLNCKCGGSVVLSNNTYSWVPVLTVFLQWKTIPELKVDEKWKRRPGGEEWTRVGSSR